MATPGDPLTSPPVNSKHWATRPLVTPTETGARGCGKCASLAFLKPAIPKPEALAPTSQFFEQLQNYFLAPSLAHFSSIAVVTDLGRSMA